MQDEKNIYLVASYTNTCPGRIIKARGILNFWNRSPGDYYSHVSLSRDDKLNHMMSFARKNIKNPFDSGLVEEDIHKGLFAINPEKNSIAVMQLKVSESQYDTVTRLMEFYWSTKEQYSFNFLGLMSMLIRARGLHVPDRFFCSEWCATILQEAGIALFDSKKPCDVRPFDFYGALIDHIIYEGSIINYPNYHADEVDKANESLYSDVSEKDSKILQLSQNRTKHKHSIL